ncbi:AsnC family protein, partial [Acinetobacter baumannii]
MSTIDELDQRILDVLLTESRISLKQLAEQVGLSSPS